MFDAHSHGVNADRESRQTFLETATAKLKLPPSGNIGLISAAFSACARRLCYATSGDSRWLLPLECGGLTPHSKVVDPNRWQATNDIAHVGTH